ncbi:MAG: DNA-binding response regulator [Aquificaceae bacterium]|nr:MAG: DNA-binding response regulator [Aquificaceae bacterium]
MLQRFSHILEKSDEFSLGFTCSTLSEGLENLINHPSNILLLDLGLPDGSGIELIKFIRDQGLSTNVIVISVFGDEKHILSAISAGAMGYLLKDEEHQKIETSIMQMLKGGSPISPSIARHLLKYHQEERVKNTTPDVIKIKLTNREIDILKKISKGYSCKEISEMENISYHTVATHVRNIYKKLSVNSRAEALYEAYTMGIL